MANSANYRWRKTTDVNREHALFELLDGGAPILDVGFTDEGVFEVSFNPCIGGKVMEWNQLLKILEEGRNFADRDR